jgi:hypothetical protein
MVSVGLGAAYQYGYVPHRRRLLRARRERPRRRGAEKGDELVPFELIELHSVPAGRIAGYRTGGE